MRTVSDILSLWPRSIDLARDLGMSPPRISDLKSRNAIPVAYWRDLVRAARKRGHPEITADLLMNLHARESNAGLIGLEEVERPFERQQTPVAPSEQPVGTGHFSRFKHHRRNNFQTAQEIEDHINALRDEWSDR